MGKKIIIGSMLVVVLFLLMPSFPALKTNSTDEKFSQNIEVLDWVRHPLLYILIKSMMTSRWNFGIKLRDFSIETDPLGGFQILHPLLLLWWFWIYTTVNISYSCWQSFSYVFGWNWELPSPH